MEADISTDLGISIPETILQVSYNDKPIETGEELKPEKVKDKPVVSWEAQDDKTFYTLIMQDPDAPSRQEPKFREWHHWLVTNIPGNNIESGDESSEYIGAGPPKGTGLHRYVFLLFKQENGFQLFPGLTQLRDDSATGRKCWKVAEFAEQYNLGDPVAANYFVAEWEPYVTQLYLKLSKANRRSGPGKDLSYVTF